MVLVFFLFFFQSKLACFFGGFFSIFREMNLYLSFTSTPCPGAACSLYDVLPIGVFFCLLFEVHLPPPQSILTVSRDNLFSFLNSTQCPLGYASMSDFFFNLFFRLINDKDLILTLLAMRLPALFFLF